MEEIVLHFKTNYYSSGSLEPDCCLSRTTSNKWSGPHHRDSTRTFLDNKTGDTCHQEHDLVCRLVWLCSLVWSLVTLDRPPHYPAKEANREKEVFWSIKNSLLSFPPPTTSPLLLSLAPGAPSLLLMKDLFWRILSERKISIPFSFKVN